MSLLLFLVAIGNRASALIDNKIREELLATLAELQTRRTAVLSALTAAYAGQSYSRGSAGGSSLSFQRQSIPDLRTELDKIDAEIARAGGTAGKFVYVRPRDD